MSGDTTRTPTRSASSINRTDTLGRLAELFMAFGGAYKCWLHDRLSAETGITQHRALGELGYHGPIQMNALGRELGVTPRYVTAIVDALEADGLARRRPHPDDRRATLVELTAAGEALYRKGAQLFRVLHEELLTALSPAQREALVDSLETLLAELRRIERAGGAGAAPPSAA